MGNETVKDTAASAFAGLGCALWACLFCTPVGTVFMAVIYDGHKPLTAGDYALSLILPGYGFFVGAFGG